MSSWLLSFLCWGAGCQSAKIRSFDVDGGLGPGASSTLDASDGAQGDDGRAGAGGGSAGKGGGLGGGAGGGLGGQGGHGGQSGHAGNDAGKSDAAADAVPADARPDGLADALANLDGPSDAAVDGSGSGPSPCMRDDQCSPDLGLGTPMLCFDGFCRTGECHTSADCQSGELCGAVRPHFCGSCATDQACTSDTKFGAGFLCVAGACVRGDCHDTSGDCSGAAAGEICGGKASFTCGACVLDAQCQTDPVYGPDTICSSMAGGRCASAACGGEGTTCAQNGSDVCCGGRCVGGNCCGDADCVRNALFGAGWTCKAHTCSKCDAATGNHYVVDPVGGNDDTATGSGTSGAAAQPACAFRTLTRALALIGSAPPAGTTVTVLGQGGTSTPLFVTAAGGGESLPIVVPAHVTITTSGGPITLALGGKVAGFKLVGADAALTPIAGAPLLIDGGDHLSDSGVYVSAGAAESVKLAHVRIENTGNDAINVTSGVALIGPGVQGRHSGTASAPRSGLHVIGGAARVEVAKEQASTSFNDNTLNGIRVVNASVVSVSGVPGAALDGMGSVVVRGNQSAGFFFAQTPGMVAASAVSVIDGLVAWGNQGPGLRLFGGTNAKLRRSVLLANGTDGVLISPMDNTSAGQSVALLDLGTAAEPGRNFLQQAIGASPNLDAGLCLTVPQAKLMARGNVFAGPTDCASATDVVLTRSAGCNAHADLGVSEMSASVDVAACK